MKRALIALVPLLLTLSLQACGTSTESDDVTEPTDNGQPDLFVPPNDVPGPGETISVDSDAPPVPDTTDPPTDEGPEPTDIPAVEDTDPVPTDEGTPPDDTPAIPTDAGPTDAVTTPSDAATPPSDDGPGPTIDVKPVEDVPTPVDIGTPQPDAGNQCSEICGDVNQDGLLTVADVGALQELMPGTGITIVMDPCVQNAADTFRDGLFTAADVHQLKGLLSGIIADACSPCANGCGDVNGDGDVNNLDVDELVAAAVEPPPMDACVFWSGDLIPDELINLSDVMKLADHLANGTLLSCIE